ncbi:MAG: hypothetical protein ABI903_16165 [Actinomycetota bacterium]
MNQLRDRLAAANPVPELRYYSREQITAAVSIIVSEAAQADPALTKHKSADQVRMPVAAALSPGAPALNRSRRRWVYLVPAAAGLAALLAVVGLPGRQDSAYAGWTAMPTGVSVPDSAKVEGRCMSTSKENFGGELSRIGNLSVVLAERRGQWIYALLANGNNVVGCLQNENNADADGSSIVQSSGSDVAPKPPARGVTTITMVGGGFTTIFGRAGAEVAKVVVNGPGGRVTATVKGGYWAAWWPDNIHSLPIPPAASRYDLTVTLRDGTQLPLIRPWPALK